MTNNINTPEELLKYMDNIEYGFTDKENHNYVNNEFNENVFTKWFLSSPKRLNAVKHGDCYDQVEFEREWFIKHNYKIHTYFLIFLLPYKNPFSTHTILVYEENKKYYLFEHADYLHRGIRKFNSLEELINKQKKYLLEYNLKNHEMTEKEINSLTVFEYQKPKYNINKLSFINNIIDKGKIIK